MLAKVISGGQTGADQGALRAAKAAGIPTGGFAPLGWLTEDGPAPWLDDGFGLCELQWGGYPERTRENVREATGLVWFGNPYSPGGKLTLSCCHDRGVPYFVVLDWSTPRDVADWIHGHLIEGETGPVVLMVAGNRESKSPGIGARVEKFMSEVFRFLKEDLARG